MSTTYWIARAADQVSERRRLATHPPRVRPEMVAHGPGEVWSWDITALKGPAKGIWYKCYVILDIFSRYVTGWLVAAAEDAVVAKDFLADAIARNGCEPHTVHADRGGAMVSKPVSELLVNLGVLWSHSRPRTSNDNPYSEAQFKTMKYVPGFPDRFGSLADARAFCEGLFLAYNHEHRHSGIGMHTSACISGRPSRSAPSARSPSTELTPRTRNASHVDLGHLYCPRSPGSTGPPTSHNQSSKAPTVSFDLTTTVQQNKIRKVGGSTPPLPPYLVGRNLYWYPRFQRRSAI